MPLVTQAEYAKLRGCSEAAVSIAKKERIKGAVVTRDGKTWIDSEKADLLWQRNSRPRRGAAQAANPDRKKPAAPSLDRLPTDQELQAFIMGLPEDQIPDDLGEITRRKERYEAERRRVAALKDRGEVVPAADVKAEAFECARGVRDALLRLADRLAPLLAATTDARECHRLLSEEHRVALRALADG